MIPLSKEISTFKSEIISPCTLENKFECKFDNKISHKFENFTYKSPSINDFNEFKSEDHMDLDSNIEEYLNGITELDSLSLHERLRNYGN